jgi:hypothetical protein
VQRNRASVSILQHPAKSNGLQILPIPYIITNAPEKTLKIHTFTASTTR